MITEGEEKCLEHSLEWMKQLALLGDQALSEMDWETQGFRRVGTWTFVLGARLVIMIC